MEGDRFDAAVVGGSFAGLTAAMQLARARRRVLVVDAGRPRNRFAHASHGFLGQDGRAPAEIMAAGRAEVLAYPTASFRADEVTHAERVNGGGFALRLASGTTITAGRLVLATGVADELPDVPGLRERWGVTVLHCPYCHGYEVADGRFGVLATGERAGHQAQLVTDWSADVTLFTRGFALDAEARAAVLARGVRIEERPVVEVIGDAPAISGVRLADGEVIAIDALFTMPRTRMASPLAEQLGCAFDDGPLGPSIRTDERKETTVPGVFAAGDVVRFFANATLAAADGVIAGGAAHQSLVFAPGGG